LNPLLFNTPPDLDAIPDYHVVELARRTVTPRSKSLFVACSQLPTLNAVVRLRTEFSIPIWSSIQATAWAGAAALTNQGLPVRFNQAA
jgi:maleate isomerase